MPLAFNASRCLRLAINNFYDFHVSRNKLVSLTFRADRKSRNMEDATHNSAYDNDSNGIAPMREIKNRIALCRWCGLWVDWNLFVARPNSKAIASDVTFLRSDIVRVSGKAKP